MMPARTSSSESLRTPSGRGRTARSSPRSRACSWAGMTNSSPSCRIYSFPELGVEAKELIEMRWIESTLFFAGYPTDNKILLLDRRPYRNRTFKGKSDFAREPISAEAWDKIWKYLLDAEDELVLQIILSPWGGLFDELPEDSIPFPHRKGNLINLQYFLFWPDSPDEVNQKQLDWMRKFYDFMAPYVSKNPRATYFNVKD